MNDILAPPPDDAPALRFDPVSDIRNVPTFVSHRACLRCQRPFEGEDAVIVHRKVPTAAGLAIKPCDLGVGMLVCMKCMIPQVDYCSLIVPHQLWLPPGGMELPWPHVVSGVLASGYIITGKMQSGVYFVVKQLGHVWRGNLMRAKRAVGAAQHGPPQKDPTIEMRVVSLGKAEAPDLMQFRQPVKV